MPKYRNFSLGVNNANPSDQIDDSELSVAENVEYNGSANPEKREGLKASELNDALDFLVGISGDVTKFIAWSPKIMPNVSYGSYVYIIFTTVYEVHVIYKLNEKSWVSYQIEIEDIIYTSASSSVISFTKAVDRIVITDGVNKAHFFKIDRDGILVDGIMEYPAPKYIPKIEVMAEYIDENFETNIEESKLGECGLYVYCWCYADKWLNLSNPSPVSDPIDRQFFSFDEDGDPDKWVESFRITNMKIPEIDEDTKRNIKFIYLFRKYYKHTEDLTNMDWDLYSVYEIPNVEAFNEILDFNDTGEGQALDYGNAAPVASGALAQGNSIFLAGCKTKDTFLWEFEWAFPISINNQNNNIKVNKVYRVRITEAMMGRRNGEEEYPFKLNEFFTSLDRMRKLCFFAQDKTTPIKSMLITTSSTRAGREVYFDAFIQIPNLNPGFNIIYFNFTTLDNDAEFEGIPQEFIDLEDKYSYGRMFVPYDIGSVIGADDWTKQTMFTTKYGSLENARNLVNCPMLMKGTDDEVINRYDDKWNGVTTNCSWVTRIATVPFMENIADDNSNVGVKAIRLNSQTSKIIFGDNIHADNNDNVCVRFRCKFNTGDIVTDCGGFNTGDDELTINTLFSNVNISNDIGIKGWFFGIRKTRVEDVTDPVNFGFYAGYDNDNGREWTKEYLWDDFDIRSELGSNTNVNLDFTLSFNPDEKDVWLYVIDDENNVLIDGKINLEWEHYGQENTQKLGIGNTDDGKSLFEERTHNNDIYKVYFIIRALPGSIFQNISYVKNRTIDNVNTAINMANFMHHTEGGNLIGYNWITESAFNNITIQEGYPVEYKDRNSIMWSNTNSVRFKLSNQREFKEAHKIMLPAPYFIATEYGNSVLEITRNSINRINLRGTPDEWTIDSNNFIEEFSNLGALSPGGWGTFRDRVFGHTESGFVMWSKEDFRIISNKKVATAGGFSEVPRLIVPMKTTLISFPVPLRNQYIWHDNDTNISYVYHIDQDAWTIFTGLNIIDTDIIDKGDALENLTLMLTSRHLFKLYPSGSYTEENIEIRTKAFALEDYMVKKIIPHFDGLSSNILVTVVNRDNTVTRTFQQILDNKIQYVQNGAWGHKFDLKFTGDIQKLYDVEIILQRRF